MKSFFVIKGKPNRWFDQFGEEMPIYKYDTPDFRHIIAHEPVACDYEIHNPERIKTITLTFHVHECKDVDEVKSCAMQKLIDNFYVSAGANYVYANPHNGYRIDLFNPYQETLKVTIEKI